MDSLNSNNRTGPTKKGGAGKRFGKVLESRSGSEDATQAAEPGTQLNASTLRILLVLAQHDAMPLTDLIAKSGLEFDTFIGALQQIRKQNLVTLEGSAGSEIVTLTPQGKQLVQV